MVLDLYNRLPEIRITDLLLEVDNEIGFTEAFTHLRTGVPCKDRVDMLNVLLAEGLNLGLSKKWPGPPTPMIISSSLAYRDGMSKVRRWHAPWPW
ncbi:Tn3 transposase DDE domain-containing protein [Primorskyibacter flagellatus]|uniref:Tn3 transposase DDE domain-containing protein n=1 Tax=Primorskyibacter flagellatus TaxID=1387277 RepID=A0A1W2E0M9_9RHOB|nr:Tn3 transposase DDE domain-containing protein [Primorskyibacter flagellatus]